MMNLLKKLFKWSEPKETKYYYHISYFYKDKNGTGHGCTSITTTHLMDTIKSIENVSEYLKNENKFDVIILNSWQLLKGE